MNLNGLTIVLAQAASSGAPGAAQQQPPGWMSIVPFALMGIILYFLMIRPQ